MDPLLDIGLRNALLAAVLAVPALAASRWRRQPALAHALWVVVLLRLVAPPLWQVPVDWPAPALEVASNSTLPEAPIGEDEGSLDPDEFPSAVAAAPTTSPLLLPSPSQSRGPGDGGEGAARPLPWRAAGAVVWLLGAGAVLLVTARRAARFNRLLRHARPAPESLRRHADAVARRLGLRRPPVVLLMPGRITPLVWAAGGRPKLILPAGLWDRLAPARRSALLAHELAHLVRGDHWLRWLELAVGSLFWWHPVAWLARRGLREAEERCCDAWVVWALPGAKRQYAEALVDAADYLCTSTPAAPALASGLGPVHHLRRRLTMILREPTSRRLPRFGLLAVLGAGLLALSVGVTGRAASFDDEPQQPPRPGDRPKEKKESPDDPQMRRELERARAAFEEARERMEHARK